MKVVTSLLGDKWFIDENGAKPELGDRIFGANDNMIEMLEKSQTSEKWAQRLQQIASAEINEDKTAIYVPDQKNFNWYREISLKEPEFRTHNDYFNGFLLVYPDDKRLSVSEQVAEPGAYYGPYYVLISNKDGSNGVVGFTEEYDDLPKLMESLKDRDLIPLPRFSTLESTVYDLCDGYKAETTAVENHQMDIWTVLYETTILSPKGEIVSEYSLHPNHILSIRDSSEELQRIISKASQNEHITAAIKRSNESLSNFKTVDNFSPINIQDLKDKLSAIPQNTPVKLTCADGETELLISFSLKKAWRLENGGRATYDDAPSLEVLNSLGADSLRLCYEKEYKLEAKKIDGFSISSNKANTLNVDNLYAMLSDPEELKKLTKEHQEQFEECTGMNIPTQTAILQQIESDAEEVELVSERKYSVRSLIKIAQEDLAKKSSNSYGMSTP